MMINPELLELAEWRLRELAKQATTKQAFVPPGDPSGGGGGPPGTAGPADPSMGGGAPPMDPSMMGGGGGAPPMDPSMMGGAVPGGGGLTADSIAQIVSQTMQQQQQSGAMGGPGGPAGANKLAKPDIATVAIDIFQVKKMLQYLFNTMGIPLPPDILDGPNRDPRTGASLPPGAPGSTSDPAGTAANAQQAQAGGGGAPPGGGGAIPPIEPMQGAAPPSAAGPGPEKSGEDKSLYMGTSFNDSFDPRVINKAAALSAIVRKLSRNKK